MATVSRRWCIPALLLTGKIGFSARSACEPERWWRAWMPALPAAACWFPPARCGSLVDRRGESVKEKTCLFRYGDAVDYCPNHDHLPSLVRTADVSSRMFSTPKAWGHRPPHHRQQLANPTQPDPRAARRWRSCRAAAKHRSRVPPHAATKVTCDSSASTPTYRGCRDPVGSTQSRPLFRSRWPGSGLAR